MPVYEPHTRYSSSAGRRRRTSTAARAAYPHESRARRSPYPRSRVVIDALAPHPRYPPPSATQQTHSTYSHLSPANLHITPSNAPAPHPSCKGPTHTHARLGFATTSTPTRPPTRPRRTPTPTPIKFPAASCTLPHPSSAAPSNACAQSAARTPLAAPAPSGTPRSPLGPARSNNRGRGGHRHTTVPSARRRLRAQNARLQPADAIRPRASPASQSRYWRAAQAGVRRPLAAARRRGVRGA
ncbi:hypothetical protein C8J57DRAFT_1393286, partial [Mycena rebaudengoi]